jgi:hypothetical protein
LDGSVPPVVFHQSPNNEIGVFSDGRRIMPVLWVCIITTASELHGRDDPKSEVGKCIWRRKGIICVREAREGRAGLPVNDRVLKTFPVCEGIGEIPEERGDGSSFKVFVCFSRLGFGCLFS